MSRDDEQLNGKPITTPSADCEPYRYATVNGENKIIAPCGAIANSIFNGMSIASRSLYFEFEFNQSHFFLNT